MKTIEKDFLRKSSALICMLTLLISIVVVSSLGSEAASAQTAEGCKKLAIPNVSANFQRTGNEATKAIDSNLDTRWAYEGEGAYIQADLGSSAILCSVDIAWYRGDSSIL